MTKQTIAWHSLSPQEVLKKIGSSEEGLSSQEWSKRYDKYGPNKLSKAEHFSSLAIFFSQFKSALVYVLLIAGVISLIFKEYVDVYVIFAAVLLNVIVGFFQERKANKSLEQLNEVVKLEALVVREGNEGKIDSSQLVPGDIIILHSGNRVPADARLLEENDLQINEAPLTGESWPVQKRVQKNQIGTILAERNCMVFAGTLIVEGKGRAVIVSTGLETEVGQITALLKDTKEEKTPLQKKLDNFAKNITKLIAAVAILLFIFGLLEGQPWLEMFTIAVAVAVSAIPEGLVISMTVILTVGMQRILKHNGLVRKLVSAETLGSTTVICTDKTGTLTEGQMKVTRLKTGHHVIDFQAESYKDMQIDKEFVLMTQIALLCNDSLIQNRDDDRHDWKIIGSPTESALFKFGLHDPEAESYFQKYERLQEMPFDSQRKFMVTRHRLDKNHDIIFLKGAPEKVLGFSSKYQNKSEVVHLTEAKREQYTKNFEEMSKEGLRVLSGAYKLVSHSEEAIDLHEKHLEDFIFVGIWGLSDPLRPDTKSMLEHTVRAGIRTVIITGDNKFTAQKIAGDLGIKADDDSVVTGDELLKMSDEELKQRVQDIKVYARVTPADKLRIVKAWQSRGEVVSMTGDGVNDAPALKAADIGVAVSSGSDVAKETADLVLLDNNFSTIVMAIKQGRVIFANIKKVILYLLSSSFSEIILIVCVLIIGIPLPILTAQILWVNLMNDGLPALSLTMEPEENEIMDARQTRDKKLLNFLEKFLISTISLVTGLSCLFVFYHLWSQGVDLDTARTVTFTTLGLSTLLYIYSVKSLKHSIFTSHPFQNKYLNGAVLIGISLQMMAVYVPIFNKALRTVPLGWDYWPLILAVSLGVVVLIEIIKFIFIKRHYQD